MKTFTILAAFLGLSCPAVQAAEPVRLAEDLLLPQPIMVADEPLVVEGFAAPCFTDFDGDGVCDLLVGQYHGGRLRIYRNVRSNAEPQFTTSTWFQADGQIANVTNCCRTAFTPRLIDFDGDGDQDVLTGSGNGCLYVFPRQANGTFAAAELLLDREGESLFVVRQNKTRRYRYPYNSAAFPFDWDNDGDWDLVIGTGYGFSRNLGTIDQPQFEMTQPLLADGEPLTVGLPPCVADWDGDGLSDLIVGTHKQIRWHRNVGQAGSPSFGPAEILVDDSNASFPEGHFHAVDVVDFNGDGKMDLLVGDSKYISEPNGSPPPPHLAQSHAQASEALREIQRVKLPENASHAQQIAHHQELLKRWQMAQRTRASNGRREGRVWIYARVGK